jgi:hypothetical protein
MVTTRADITDIGIEALGAFARKHPHTTPENSATHCPQVRFLKPDQSDANTTIHHRPLHTIPMIGE